MSTTPTLNTVPVPDDTTRRVATLVRAVHLFNGMVTRKLTGLFPADLVASDVRAHLTAHAAAVEADRHANDDETSVASSNARARRDAAVALRRLHDTVDGMWPHGAAERADFFVRGAAPRGEADQLRAMIRGFKAHGTAALPPDLSLDDLKSLQRALSTGTTEVGRTRLEAEAARVQREHLETRTREIVERLTAVLRGYFGRTSPDLTAFGLAPYRRKARAARKPAAPVAPVPGDVKLTVS